MKNTYRIAEKNIEIDSMYEDVHRMCEAYLTCNAPEIFVKTGCDEIEFERKKSTRNDELNGISAVDYRDSYLETLAVYRQIAERMPDYNTLLFHGSCVSVDGEAYLFAAESGTGKSTHTRLWRQYLGDRAVMVNDDKPLIRIEKGSAIVYGTPWNGKHRLGNNISVPLRAICLLERGAENSIERISKKEALPFIIKQTYRPASTSALAKTLGLIDNLNPDFYRLKCNMDISAAELSYGVMSTKEIEV